MASEIRDETVLAVAEDVSFQRLSDDQAVVLSLGEGQLYTCNPTSEAFLSALDGRRSFAAVVEQLHGRFEVDPQRLRADLLALARRMIGENLIVARRP